MLKFFITSTTVVKHFCVPWKVVTSGLLLKKEIITVISSSNKTKIFTFNNIVVFTCVPSVERVLSMLHRASYKFGDTEKTNYDLQLKVSRILTIIRQFYSTDKTDLI